MVTDSFATGLAGPVTRRPASRGSTGFSEARSWKYLVRGGVEAAIFLRILDFRDAAVIAAVGRVLGGLRVLSGVLLARVTPGGVGAASAIIEPDRRLTWRVSASREPDGKFDIEGSGRMKGRGKRATRKPVRAELSEFGTNWSQENRSRFEGELAAIIEVELEGYD